MTMTPNQWQWRRLLAALVVAAVGLLAACSSTAGEAKPAAPNTSTTSNAESAPQASVEDFARVVAEQQSGWDDTVADLDSLCLDPATVPACHATYFTLSMKAETIRLALSTVHKPDAPGYVGVPPTEIEDLLSETESAADTASIMTNDLIEAADCDDPFADTCIEQRFAADSAIEDLSSKLDAWAVYS